MSTSVKPSIDMAHKSVAACLSSIEIYNKPDFKYREETFSILMINAWELMLKAKILKDNADNIDSITVFEEKPDPSGAMARAPKLSRSGNAITYGLDYMVKQLEQRREISQRCQKNLEALTEIRDNAVHFINKDLHFSKKIQEIGLASLKNYIFYVKGWFSGEIDLSKYNFFLMPLSFFHDFESVETTSVSPYSEQMQRLLLYINEIQDEPRQDGQSGTPDEEFVALRMECKLFKSNKGEGLAFRVTNDPSAPAIQVKEEDVLARYPLTYEELVSKLKDRYDDFKVNEKFLKIKKSITNDPRYCHQRYLDPRKPKSGLKRLYTTEALKEFDQHYKRPKNR